MVEPASLDPLILVPVLVLAADIGFIDLHDTDQLAELWIGESGADTHTHIVSCLVRAKTHHAMDLQGRNAFLAGQHEVNDLKPLAQSDVAVLEHGADQNRETVVAWTALIALPVKGPRLEGPYLVVAAAGALNYTIRPAAINEVSFAGVIRGKQRLELGIGHLAGEFRLAHRSRPHV